MKDEDNILKGNDGYLYHVYDEVDKYRFERNGVSFCGQDYKCERFGEFEELIEQYSI